MKEKVMVKTVGTVLSVLALIALISAGPSYGASGLTVKSSLEQIDETYLQCHQLGNSSTALNLDLKGIAETPVEVSGNNYQKIHVPAGDYITAGSMAEVGNPDLPVYSTSLIIPNNVGVEIRINSVSYETLENYDIAPVQYPHIEGEDNHAQPFAFNETVYNSNTFYPEQLVSASDPVIMRDFRGVTVTVNPVQYNPVTRQLRVYTDIDFDVVYSGTNPVNPAPVQRDYISDAFRPLYKSTFANFDQLYGDLPSKRGGYLIITHDAFVDSLTEFADWKHHKGYDVKLVKLSDIASNPSSYHIFNYIQDAYTTWEFPPEYVVLVGDVTMPVGSFPDYSYSYYTSDHKYACVDGNDFFPDLFISRMAIDTDRELHWLLQKTLRYEQSPASPGDGWMRRGLSVAGNIYAFTPRLTTLWVREQMFQNGFTQVDTCFDWGSGAPIQTIRDALNAGVNIVAYRGWAGPSGWYNPSYHTYDLNNITNEYRGGIMTSIVCGTGHYGSSTDPCFGEVWIRGGSSTEPRGGVAFFGATDTGTHTEWNNPIMVGFYWGLFNEDLTNFCQSMVRGKIRQYNTFPTHNQPGGTVEKYFHTYNALGDPEVNVWRGTPDPMQVQYDEEITVSTNYLGVQVYDSERMALKDAYVCLLKSAGGEDEIFSVGKTDESGYVLIPFDTNPTPGDIDITVTHRDFLPHMNTVPVTAPDVSVGFTSYSIDDDNNGYSHGNSDGEANPAEYIELTLTVINNGTNQATDVSGTLSISDEYGEVLSPAGSFGDIPAGGSAPSTEPFVVMVSRDCPSGYMLPFELTLSDNGGNQWKSVAEIEIASPALMVSGITIDDASGNGNGILDGGETASVVLDITNNGTGDALALEALLDTDDAYIEISDNIGAFGDIGSGQTGDNNADRFTIYADSDIFEGRVCHFKVKATSSTGMEVSVPFSIEIGNRTSNDPTGPDNYGYFVYDNTDTDYSEAPVFDYVDISGMGTRVANGDDVTDLVNLPFDFVYYGDTYTAIGVSSNGFVAVDTASYDMQGNMWALFYNWPIPDPGGSGGQISPFWDDLTGASGGGIYYYYDSPNNRFIVEWHDIRTRWDYGSAYETFELIIYDKDFYPTQTGDCMFAFLYDDITDSDSDENYSSVGFESFEEYDGIQYAFCNRYADGSATLQDGRALLITTNTGRGSLDGRVTLSGNPNNSGVKIMTSTGQKGHTDYFGNYFIRDAETGSIDLQFTKRGYFPETVEGVSVVGNTISMVSETELQEAPLPQSLSLSGGGDHIVLNWLEAGPSAIGYDLYRSEFENGIFVKLNDDPIDDLTYSDYNVIPDREYWYYAEAVYSNAYSNASNMVHGSTSTTGIGENDNILPTEFALKQNYPNPFNPTTVIEYALPADANVNLSIYNLMGQKVVTLVDGIQQAGYKSVVWDGNSQYGIRVSSGIYFYRIEAGSFNQTKRMMLLK
ncbi:MAG: T9SS type A sorting domain-containing protein [candidate division Zixibacteria bacterium]|nr:T9SS type A sorting domain-containing protein [candidate division Zixibacteria bacterium]